MQKPEEPRITRMSRMDTCVPPDRDALEIAYAIHRALRIPVISGIRGLPWGKRINDFFEARIAAQRVPPWHQF